MQGARAPWRVDPADASCPLYHASRSLDSTAFIVEHCGGSPVLTWCGNSSSGSVPLVDSWNGQRVRHSARAETPGAATYSLALAGRYSLVGKEATCGAFSLVAAHSWTRQQPAAQCSQPAGRTPWSGRGSGPCRRTWRPGGKQQIWRRWARGYQLAVCTLQSCSGCMGAALPGQPGA